MSLSVPCPTCMPLKIYGLRGYIGRKKPWLNESKACALKVYIHRPLYRAFADIVIRVRYLKIYRNKSTETLCQWIFRAAALPDISKQPFPARKILPTRCNQGCQNFSRYKSPKPYQMYQMNTIHMHQMVINYPEISQGALKSINIFQSRALKKLLKLLFLVWK
jgi:hypothetical protein